MLTIFSPCEGATDGPWTGAREREHGVHEPEAKVRHRGDVPIFLWTARPIHEKGVPVCRTRSWSFGEGGFGNEGLETTVNTQEN